MRIGIVKDRRFADHRQGPGHVESPERIAALNRMVEEEVRFPFMLIEPRPATEREIGLIHTPGYVGLIRSTAGRERTVLDADTSASALSWETARLAAGAVIEASGAIMDGKIKNALALVRPPGHHAEADAARGFCIFNNIAIAAESLVHDHGLKRILIVDWDLHHGNGTQHAFYARRDVLFFSTHQHPLYPGTGHWSETGEGQGRGFTLNVPLSPGKTDADYLFIYRKLLAPAARRFKPEFILVSAGFDICGGDPLGGMDISPQGFGALTAELLSLAEEFCGGRLLVVLEGGYSLPCLCEGAKEVLLQMAGTGTPPAIEAGASADTLQELAPIVQVFKKFWEIEI
jgi:acetoin utilization deacetylase AcuC-like enzyme